MTRPREEIRYDYPWRLRLSHEGDAGIRVERRGRALRFDPATRPAPDDVVLLTGPGPDRTAGTLDAARANVRPTVVAPDGVIDWLTRHGPVEGGPAPREIDGVQIRSLSYAPPRPGLSGVALSGVNVPALLRTGPATALRNIRARLDTPAAEPHALDLRFPDGARLLHLDLSLHRHTPPDWVDRAATLFAAPEWLIIGNPWGEGDAVLQWLPRFQPRRVLLTDLVNSHRRRAGLPTELITPLRDRLVGIGIETHVFAPQASYRFE